MDFGRMREYYTQAWIPDRQKKSVIDAIMRFEKQLQSISWLSPLPAVKYILKAVGYEQYLRERAASMPGKWQEWQEVLEWLLEDAARFASCKEWEISQKEYNEAMEQKREQKTAGNSGNAIQLLTVHGAKGLEFDSVWIPDCNEKIFPHGAMPDLKAVEEERRIFYVAMTRAKENLELLYITGTKERSRLPSRFLNPLV